MRGDRLMGVTSAVVAACAFVVPSAIAAGGPANWMYEPTSYTEVQLTLPPASEAALEKEPKEYVEGTFELAETDGTPGSAGPFSAPLTVGIELKGSLGSLRKLSEKAAFKVKFDKFVKGQTFMGLEKMTFNNMVQDPSMIHESVTYAAFHRMGVPAPYTGFTYLTVNGKSYGIHLNIETQDVQSVENAFGTTFQAPPQHLYEGEYGADTTNARWEEFEVSEGKKKYPGDKADLEALVAAVEATGSSFSQRVAAHADLSEMTRNWLVEKYVGNWDGYAGMAPDATHPNNYYLYSDTAGKFSMMPWGTDQTWQSWHHMAFDSGGGVLFSQCLADPAGCRQQYLAAGSQALTALNAPELDDLARCTTAALRPWQEYEAATSEPEKLPDPSLDAEKNLKAAETEAVETRKFIGRRPEELATYLGEPTPTAVPTGDACPPLRPIGGFPMPPPEEEEEAVSPATSGSDGGAGTSTSTPPASSPAPPSVPNLTLGRRAVAGGSIAMTVAVPGPGRLSVEGKAGRPKWTACRGSVGVTAAGSAELTCRLNARFAALLQERWRRVRIDVRFEPAAGSPELLRQSIRLRRR